MAENRIADAADPVLPTRAALADQVALHTCTRNCWGKAGDAAGCCRLDDRNFVQGPVRDTAAVLAYVSKRQGRDVPYAEVFIDAREGAALFPTRSAWQHEQNFPAHYRMRAPATRAASSAPMASAASMTAAPPCAAPTTAPT